MSVSNDDRNKVEIKVDVDMFWLGLGIVLAALIITEGFAK